MWILLFLSYAISFSHLNVLLTVVRAIQKSEETVSLTVHRVLSNVQVCLDCSVKEQNNTFVLSPLAILRMLTVNGWKKNVGN